MIDPEKEEIIDKFNLMKNKFENKFIDIFNDFITEIQSSDISNDDKYLSYMSLGSALINCSTKFVHETGSSKKLALKLFIASCEKFGMKEF